jgi:hypothetical protein
MGDSMSLVLPGATSGAITIDAPAVAGTNALTLPASTGTLALVGSAITKSQLPAGTVLQTVTWTYNPSVQFSMTSNTTYTTFTSAPTASITLTNSANKVLIIARIGMQWDSNDQLRNTIYRSISGGSTTDLSNGNVYGLSFHGVSGTGGLWKDSLITYVDSPATSNEVTYKWYSKTESGTTAYPDHGNSSNSMILMEIAA